MADAACLSQRRARADEPDEANFESMKAEAEKQDGARPRTGRDAIGVRLEDGVRSSAGVDRTSQWVPTLCQGLCTDSSLSDAGKPL